MRTPSGSRPADRLLAWYDAARRDLPWRAAPGVRPDPYRVFLSEIMLQQTTVAAVAPYFTRFTERWPDIAALGLAPLDEVLKEWAGLGYYARARNLHACARTVATELGGRFPETEEGLRALPGIGPYTAAAIAAIAFDAPCVPVDGNVERVVARLHGIGEPLPGAKPKLRELARAFLPTSRPGDLAQALMDLGATLCTPKRPSCPLCPLAPDCIACRAGNAEELPRRQARAERPLRRGAVFVLERGDGRVLLRRRPLRGLLGGMSEFPSGDWVTGAFPAAPDAAPAKAKWRRLPGGVRHVFTHFALELEVWHARTGGAPRLLAHADPGRCFWVEKRALSREALPSLMRKVAYAALEEGGEARSGAPRRKAR